MKFKICGIKECEEIKYINKIKADYIGFVFSESKRKISIDKCKNLIDKLDCNIKKVGVFKNENVEFILKASSECSLDIIQLHGDEDLDFINLLAGKCVWKAFKADNNLYNNIKTYNNKVDKILIDSNEAGSGKSFNFEILRGLEKEKFIIAGGIGAQNIKELLNIYRPYAVDLSSSVESDGKKSLEKLLEFKQIFDGVNI